jgi:hypothetical protein
MLAASSFLCYSLFVLVFFFFFHILIVKDSDIMSEIQYSKIPSILLECVVCHIMYIEVRCHVCAKFHGVKMLALFGLVVCVVLAL